MPYKLVCDSFHKCFVRDHACDRRTDGWTDRQTDRILIARPRLHFMQRGKSHTRVSKYTNSRVWL